MSAVQKILDSKKFVFSLLNGIDSNGDAVYAYVVYHKPDEKKIEAILADKSKSIDEYKDDLLVLITGKGETPTEEHQKIIKELMDHYSN